MPRVAWTLTDSSTGTPEVLSFEVNPNEFEPPGRRAIVATMKTSSPLGAKIIFGGGDEVPQGTMKGLVNSETFKDDLTGWFQKWWPLTLTDDLGNSWDILVQDVSWTRVRRYLYPHRYDYTVRFLEIS
jgi:hypothetical protein